MWCYIWYTHLIYQLRETSYQIGTFDDDRAIFESHENNTASLQDYLNLTQAWISKWEIKINETKSTHARFFLIKNIKIQSRFKNIQKYVKIITGKLFIKRIIREMWIYSKSNTVNILKSTIQNILYNDMQQDTLVLHSLQIRMKKKQQTLHQKRLS